MLFVSDQRSGFASYDAGSPYSLRYEVNPAKRIRPQRAVKLSDTQVAVSSATPAVSIVEADTGRVIRDIPKLSGDPGSPASSSSCWGLEAISPDIPATNPRLLLGDSERNLVLLNPETGKPILKFAEAQCHIRCTRHVREWNQSIFVGGEFGKARGKIEGIGHYDMTRAKPLQRLTGHSNWEWGMDADVSTSLLFSVSTDQKGKAWSPRESYRCVATLDLGTWGYSCRCAPDLHLLLVGLYKGDVQAWDTRKLDSKLLSFNLGGKSLYTIARIGQDCFAAAYEQVFWWRRDGKILHQTERKIGFTCYGVCGVGTDYDRPVTRDVNAIEDFDGRCELAASLLPSCPSSGSFLVSAEGTVIVPKIALLSL